MHSGALRAGGRGSACTHGTLAPRAGPASGLAAGRSPFTGPWAGAYQVVTQRLHRGLHNHVLHCHHLLLDGLLLHFVKQLQKSKAGKQKMKAQQKPSSALPSHLAHAPHGLGEHTFTGGAGKLTDRRRHTLRRAPLGENAEHCRHSWSHLLQCMCVCVCVSNTAKCYRFCILGQGVGLTHFFQTDQNPAEGTFTTLRMIRLKSPINWPEGSSISFSSWSTDLCCRPIPKRRAWRTGNLLERLRGQALARENGTENQSSCPLASGTKHQLALFWDLLIHPVTGNTPPEIPK